MNNTEALHKQMVQAIAKPAEEIVAKLDDKPKKAHLIHMTMGISGESGELLDAIKKHTIYGKPLDIANVIEELGDLEFYMEGLREALGISREETLEQNIKKLSKRYDGWKYSDEAAIKRADKEQPIDPTKHSHDPRCNSGC